MSCGIGGDFSDSDGIGDGIGEQISLCNLFIHMASLQDSVHAIYSASVDDKATVGCFLDFQVIAAFPRIKAYPDVDFRVLISLAQSESQQPTNVNDEGVDSEEDEDNVEDEDDVEDEYCSP